MKLSGYKHICSAKETFDSVALLEYEDEKYACELLNANPELSHIPVFTGGEILNLPVVEMPDTDDEDVDEEDYMPASAPWKE